MIKSKSILIGEILEQLHDFYSRYPHDATKDAVACVEHRLMKMSYKQVLKEYKYYVE